MKNSAERDERRIEQQERKKRALSLRRAGASYDQIAVALGVSRPRAFRIIRAAIDAIPAEEAQHVKRLEIYRLDVMLGALWQRAAKGENGAIETALRIMKRRAEYLGLDAPKRQEITGADGAPVQLLVDTEPTLDKARDTMRALFGSATVTSAVALSAPVMVETKDE